jgi:hypothetical protein
MLPEPEPISLRARYASDAGSLVLLATVLVPVYLLLNQYWQSIFRLALLYGALGVFCMRLARYMRRVLGRLPAEIPPWGGPPASTSSSPWQHTHFGAAEAIRSVRQDPQYVQAVLKPRLQRVLAYRLTGAPDASPEALDPARLSRVHPTLLDFLQRHEATGVWAKYRYRWQRVREVLEALRHLEGL